MSSYSFFIFQDYNTLFSLKTTKKTLPEVQMKRWWLGKKGEKNEREGKDGEEKERQSQDKERERTGHNGTKVYTDRNSCGDSKTGWEREFSLTYMVLYCRRMLFALRFKFHKSWHFCFFFYFNSIYPPHIFAPQPTKAKSGGRTVLWRSRPCQTWPNSIREIHIRVGSVRFPWTPDPHWSLANTPVVRVVCGDAAPRGWISKRRSGQIGWHLPPLSCSPVKSRCDTFLCASRACGWI